MGTHVSGVREHPPRRRVARVEDEGPARPHDACELRQSRLEVAQVREQVERQDGVELAVLEGKLARVRLHELQLGPPVSRLVEHLGRDVRHRHVVPLGEWPRQTAVAAAHVQ